MGNEVILYEFTDSGAKYVIDLKAAKAYKGEAEAACTFKMDEASFLAMVGGKADPMQLFMEGKMELDGDTDVAMKLGKVLKSPPPCRAVSTCSTLGFARTPHPQHILATLSPHCMHRIALFPAAFRSSPPAGSFFL